MAFIEKCTTPSGGYRARYRDPLGRQRSKTFRRKADALRFLVDIEADKARGNWIDPRGADMAVATWADEFMRLSRRLSPTTQDTYRRDLDKYVLPRFGAYRLGNIPADEIENWLNDELEAGLAPSSVHRHYRTLMRWSELVGLRQAKLDLRRGKVRVSEQLVRLASGEWLRKGPKTVGSVRSITVSPFTAEVLADHVERFSTAGPDGLVFPNAAGSPVQSSSYWNNHFAPAQQRADVRCRFHDLRHTSVSLAIAEGAHPKAIQSRMGHASISVTLDRYGHLFPELDEAIAASFGRRLAGASARRASAVVHASFGRLEETG
jgi:integrase